MSKKARVIGQAGGMIARKVGKQLNIGDFAGSTAHTIREDTGEIVKRVRRVSKRRKYLGSTPGKNSRTGREVIERLKNTDPPQVVTERGVEKLVWTDPLTGEESRVPLDRCDMGHSPVDAVTHWNTEGYQYGKRSAEARAWMLDPDNYTLQPSSWNRSQGARSTETYRDPV